MSTIATRREKVVLELQDDFSSGMARAAASAAALRREVDQLSRARVNISVDNGGLSSAITQVAELRREIDRLGGAGGASGSSGGGSAGGGGGGGGGVEGLTAGFAAMGGAAAGAASTAGSSINQLTGRLSLAGDAILALAPALAPIGALGGQAIGGLAAAATGAAVAGASAVVAFQGVGEAIEAIESGDLEKAREAMQGLAPEARKFVVEFQKFSPVLTEIRDAAAAGWFPGLTASLDSFALLGPQIEDIFYNVGEAGGFLADQTAESLTSERWAPFMEFIADEAPTALGSLVQIMGDLAHGASEMFQAMDPGNDAFLGWLEDVAQGFDDWASSSQGQDSIAGFLEYARQNGPAVQALFTSLVGSLSAIVQAAAPLGGAVLAGLTAVSEAIRVIAESDMATPILAAVAAMRVFNRLSGVALAAQARVATATATPAIAGAGALGPAPTPLTGAGVYAYRQQQERQARAAAQAAQRAAQQRMAVQGGVGIAAIGLLGSGAADDLNMTNTAMGALIGTMAGPWGAAAGAAAGLALDAAAANNDLAKSFETADAAISSGNLLGSMEALNAARAKQAEFEDVADAGLFEMVSPGDAAAAWKNDIEGWVGDSDVTEGNAELENLERRAHAAQVAVADLGNAFGMATGPVDGSTKSLAELNKVLETAKPAMDALGISAQDYAAASSVDKVAGDAGLLGEFARASIAEGGAGTEALNDKIALQAEYMKTAQAATDGYANAVAALGTNQGTAAEQGDQLASAISALVDPANNAEAALSNQWEALKAISELNAKGGFTVKNEVGRQNLAVSRAYVDSLKERLSTMVAAGRSEEHVAGALKRSRAQFIQSGIAAGFSADEMRRRANAIGLTPKLVRTTFRVNGLSEFDRDLETLRGKIKGLPKNVRTDIKANGIPKTMGEIDNLVEKYQLTEKDRQALISLAGTAQAIDNALAVQAAINGIQSKTVNVHTNYTSTVQRSVNRNNTIYTPADGMTLPKTGGAYYDQFPALLAPGEEVISNRYGQADRNRALLKAINDNRMADGGTAGDRYGALPGPSFRGDGGVPDEAERTRRGLRAMREALKETSAELAKEKDLRKSLIDSTRSNFSTDPFAKPDSVWAGGGDPISSLVGSIGDLREFQSIVKSLKKRGLDGAAFQEADTLEEVRVLQGMSRSELRRYEQLYEQRQRLVGTVGRGYADAVGATSSDIAKLQREVKGLRKDIAREERENRRNRDRNTDRAADDRRDSARRAAARRRRNAD